MIKVVVLSLLSLAPSAASQLHHARHIEQMHGCKFIEPNELMIQSMENQKATTCAALCEHHVNCTHYTFSGNDAKCLLFKGEPHGLVEFDGYQCGFEQGFGLRWLRAQKQEEEEEEYFEQSMFKDQQDKGDNVTRVDQTAAPTTRAALNDTKTPGQTLAIEDSPSSTTGGDMTASELDDMLERINGFRRQHGRKPVTLDEKLMDAAYHQAQQLAQNCSLGGSKPREGQQGPRNAAAGHNSVQEVMKWWIESKDQQKNLLQEKTIYVGFAKVCVARGSSCQLKTWWTQLFS